MNQTRRAGHGVFAGRGCDQHAADVLFADAALLKRDARSLNGERRRVFALAAEITLADAGSGGNPFVAGIDKLAHIVVGHRSFGQCTTGCNQL